MNEHDPILYELHYTFAAESADAAAAKVGVLTSAIEKEHGVIASQSSPMLKMLGYPIRKTAEAYTGWVRYMATPDAAPRIEGGLRAEPSLLRFLAVRAKKDEISAEPVRRRKHIAASPTTPETQATTEEIDKKLEEILGTH